jgi:anti-sigma-K factor RskA
MNLDQLQQKLLAAARAHPPGDSVPFAFEKRILAHLTGRPVTDQAAWWVRGLWRSAASCAAICVLLGAWTFFSPAHPDADDELAQQFENTVFAAVDQDGDSTW